MGDWGSVRTPLRVGEQWYNMRPDALAGYRIWQQRMRFWLEWDRGS